MYATTLMSSQRHCSNGIGLQQVARMMYADEYISGDEAKLADGCRQLAKYIANSNVDVVRNLRVKPKFHILMHADTFQKGLGPLKHISTETKESRVGESKRDVEHTNRHATNIDVIKNRIWRFTLFNLVSGCRGMDGMRIAGEGLVALFEQEPRIRDMIDVSIVDRLGKRSDGDFCFAVVGGRSHNPIAHGPALPLQLGPGFVEALVRFCRLLCPHSAQFN